MEFQKPFTEEEKDLLSLRNVGKATLEDFKLLGIHSREDLAKESADDLFLRLQELTGLPHDPCVWDIFAAAIHEVQTGEKTPWWQWTKVRKEKRTEETICF